jgi:hypothetical protein
MYNRENKREEEKMKVFQFCRWDNQEYVGVACGKDWMEARRQASKATGIPVDDMIVMIGEPTIYARAAEYSLDII